MLQIMPRQVHSWWPCLRKCHNLSVNEATYQRFNDFGFSYTPQPVDGLGSL